MNQTPALLASILPTLPAHQPEPAHENLIGARNDSDALTLFLNKAGTRSTETRRRYEREITRFTAFLYIELNLGYQAVRLKHLQAYLHFIQHLPEAWLNPGILPGQPQRTLFLGPVKSGKSTDQVVDVLSAFFSFLERNRYILGNPATSLGRSGEKHARGHSVIRYFHDKEWAFVSQCLNTLPVETAKQARETARTRFILSLGYGLALRESELTGHNCSDIHPDNDGGYFLSVLGKGRKRRSLPLNNNIQGQIRQYRQLQGYDGLHGDPFPLAPRTRKAGGRISPLTSRGLRFWWRAFMDYCQTQASDEMAARLQEMPFHGLRHTALTHLARKMDIEDLAIFAGHDSINTTSQYYHAEAHRLKKMAADHHI